LWLVDVKFSPDMWATPCPNAVKWFILQQASKPFSINPSPVFGAKDDLDSATFEPVLCLCNGV
jgi:hypothetical protein